MGRAFASHKRSLPGHLPTVEEVARAELSTGSAQPHDGFENSRMEISNK